MYCIGVDEAGYGPRLGPLVISATIWQLPDGLQPEQMYQHLSGPILSKPPVRKQSNLCKNAKGMLSGISGCPNAWTAGCSEKTATQKQWAPLVIGDSKLVYTRQGRPGLERTVLVMLTAAGNRPSNWIDLLEAVTFDPESQQAALAWYPAYWPRVPESISPEEIGGLAQWVAERLAERGIRFLGGRSLFLFPERFNRLVSHYGNKATMLSLQTLELVRRLLEELPTGVVQVVCDKHGGRDKYVDLLSATFAPSFFQPAQVKPVQESRQESIYQIPRGNGMVSFRFRCSGESLLPVALASMLSKYLRELAMEAWNRFWTEQLPGIRPTAGYPTDARRFRAAIATRQAALGIPDSAIWRNR
ncbi:MAG: hypothetical protein NZ602_00400 [Thermoguttaceae bacterium]|nr:hypothetical protein [Thermoguttaceae bacterium]MDW8037025.1 hypothetical protein [Thermoguttaceae bacterium]